MFSGSRKFVIIGLFTLALIALVNLAWWLNVRRTEGLLETQLSRRLASIAQSALVALSPETIEGLIEDDFEAFAEVTRVLESLRSADSLSEVFVLDESYHYLATTLLEADSVYFLAGLNGHCVDSLFFGFSGGAVVTPSYRTGKLYLKSAFAPLKGVDGYPVAVLGVEANVDYFESLADLRRNLTYSTGISVVVGLVLGALFLLLQQRINRAEQQLFLGQTQAYLGRMVAVVAHELRNPLMIIRASGERLAKKTGADEAGYVIEEIDRLNDIVTGYLDFAKGDTSLLTNDSPTEFELAEFLHDVRKHISEKYVETPIEWIGDQLFEPCSITGYRRSLRQVIFNLLTNGAEACTAAGKPIRLELSCKADSKHVTIVVKDQGGGLEKRELKKIFEPFYSTKQTGTGLGLYLSRRIVTEMGGQMHMSSEQGVGTQAVIELPRTPRG